MDRNTLVIDLIDEMKTEITTGNSNYKSGFVDILRGVYTEAEINNYPALCVSAFRDTIITSFSSSETRDISILLYGFADTTTDIYDLIHDVEYFLLNDYSLSNETSFDVINIIEAQGEMTESSYFDIEIKIRYSQNIPQI